MLNSLNQILTDMFGPLGPLVAVGALGMILIILTLPTLLKKRIDPLDRLKKDTSSPEASKFRREKGRSLRQSSGGAKLDRFATFLEPQDEKEYSAIRLRLLRAGYRGKDAVRTYHFAQFVLGITFLIGGVVYAIVNSATGSPSVQSTVLSILIPGLAGYYLPRYWVTRRLETRREAIQNAFPDALDMMLVCVEAGQSLDQSIVRVAQEIKVGYPALAEEFETVSAELKAGKERTAVLRDLGERAGVTDISSFVTVMIQSSTFGTSIADALRVYASEMRDKRVMRAEEKANMLPTKLTLGTMLFTVPPLLIILIGPSVYGIWLTLQSVSF